MNKSCKNKWLNNKHGYQQDRQNYAAGEDQVKFINKLNIII